VTVVPQPGGVYRMQRGLCDPAQASRHERRFVHDGRIVF
jgi:hypothetical protein